MRLTTLTLLTATMTLTACGAVRDSRVNPFNWFGRSQSVPIERGAEDAREVNPLIPQERGGVLSTLRDEPEYPGIPVDQISDLVIERVPGGAIIRATGIADVDGVYDLRLTPANELIEPVDGVLTFRLEGIHLLDAGRTTSQAQRTFTVARRLTDQQLASARIIRVEGERNAQTITRR
ncbi:MAG: hypothetical protein AAFQ19_01800 [Pseudomonadota bacterium]